MGEPLRIDCRSPAEVPPPAQLAAMTQTGQHVVLQFALLSEGDKESLISRLALALPDHSVFFSGGNRDRSCVTVMQVVTRSRVLERQGHVLRAIGEYRRACADLMAQYRGGTLPGDWQTGEHGGHCRFTSRQTGQVVEAPLREWVASERVDPYFFALFVRSTAGLEPVAELLAHDFHDAARVLDVIGGSGTPDAEPGAAPHRQ